MQPAIARALVLWILVALPSVTTAQEDSDLELLADQSSAAPNVLVLFDTSGSMSHVTWHPDFDPKRFYDAGSPCTATVYEKPASSVCPGSGRGSKCPENDVTASGAAGLGAGTTLECAPSMFVAGCGDLPADFNCRITAGSRRSPSRLRIDLPDVDGVNDVDPSDSTVIDEPDDTTYWAPNYLHWMMTQLASTGTAPAPLPMETRKMAAKRVLKDIVNELNPLQPDGSIDQQVRFGLAGLDPGASGGYVIEPIADGNTAQLLATLRSDRVRANTTTPLSEALVDMGRYYVGSYRNPDGTRGLGSYSVYNRNMVDGDAPSRGQSSPPSPIDPSIPCRDNYIIVLTDGESRYDDNNHHGRAFLDTFTADFDQDGDSNNAADYNDTLDDVAAYLFQKDLIADSVMPDKQNIVTYTIGFSLDLDVLRDAAVNGDGQYFYASSSSALAEQLRYSLEDIILRSGSFTSAAVPTSRSSFGSGFYTAYFDPKPRGTLYEGHLQAYLLTSSFDIVGDDGQSAVDPATGLFVEPRDTYFWDAGETLADPANTRRLFFTPSPLSDPNVFSAANVDAADLALTDADVPGYPAPPGAPFVNAEALADALVGYVSGRDAFDEDSDGDVTELREAVLGDIFHSSPRVVASPDVSLVAEAGFGPIGDPSSFYSLYAARDKVIYAGANDGMLHAFDAGSLQSGDDPLTPGIAESAYYDPGTGVERFGYVPGLLLSSLKRLKEYAAKPFYVDGQVSVSESWLPSSPSDVTRDPDEWTTALVVGMRNGGAGYLALDITDPGAVGGPHGPYPRLLWELSDASEPLGRTWSSAVITRVKLRGGHGSDFCGPDDRDGAVTPGASGDCREEWVAIFGGGYLEQGDPSMPADFIAPGAPGFTANGKGIFMVSLATGQTLARAHYDAADPVLAEMRFAFPSDPAVLDLDFDGFADVVYIGDTGGQLWKWDVSAVALPDVDGLVDRSTWPIDRIFVAPLAPNGHHRSFFFPPAAGLVDGKLMLAIGTGERTDLDYETAGGDENHFYVFQDPNPLGSGAFGGAPYDITDLTSLNGNGADPDPNDLGYYLEADPHEKFITNSLVFGGFVTTASYTPDVGPAAPSCDARGTATLYIFSLRDGSGFFSSDPADPDGARRVTVGSGLPASPSISVSGSEAKVVVQTSDGRIVTEDAPPSSVEPVELIFWEQQL